MTWAKVLPMTAGLDLLRYPQLSTHSGGPELLKLIRKRGRILCDAYLTDTGHQRPGMARGLPLAEAESQTAELDKSIRRLAAPVTVSLRLVPTEKESAL